MKKRVLSILVAVLLVAITFAACTGTPAPPAPPAPPASPTPGTPAPPQPSPPAFDSWAAEHLDDYRSYEEIVARAMEEGHVVWYSNSSRSRAVAEAFMDRYPGIEVEVFDISTNELVERFSREYAAGIRTADLLHLGDSDGTLWMEFVMQGMLHVYRPYDIVPYINPEFLATAMPMFIEYDAWFYNTEYFSDGPPITSWWDLTTPEWNGNIMMRHPMDHLGTLGVFTTMVQHADQMAADYERVFGTPIQLSSIAPTAAHEFFVRLMANDPIFLTSSGEIIRTVGEMTDSRFIGLGSSGGLRRQTEEDLPIQIVTHLTPGLATPGISGLYIADEANNPNAAMLLVRFMTDSVGEGFAPFDTLGGWSPRFDLPTTPGNRPINELNFWPNDSEFIYFNALQVADFLLLLN